jgi:hypothetical protein
MYENISMCRMLLITSLKFADVGYGWLAVER